AAGAAPPTAEQGLLGDEARQGIAWQLLATEPAHQVAHVPQVEKVIVRVLDGLGIGDVAAGLDRRVSPGFVQPCDEESVGLHLRELVRRGWRGEYPVELGLRLGERRRHDRT